MDKDIRCNTKSCIDTLILEELDLGYLAFQHRSMHVCMYVRTYIGIYVRTYVCTYVRTYVCMYVCMHVCMLKSTSMSKLDCKMLTFCNCNLEEI